MLYIPEGFAHGFQVLADNSELLYHHTAFYKPGSEGGIRYDDPMVRIDWPLEVTVLSGRDSQHTFLNDNFKGI
jgi:dTDP-4-dehydrorhamnose 3,5-epimerase